MAESELVHVEIETFSTPVGFVAAARVGINMAGRGQTEEEAIRHLIEGLTRLVQAGLGMKVESSELIRLKQRVDA